jgi:catechol 2,3-dioxygenase-like lactoylglutathione lyase family enzyme
MSASDRDVVENTIPVLAVADVPASIRFYCDVLEFKLDWRGEADPPQIASVSRDGHAIMLQQFQPGAPGCVWVGMSGLASLWARVRSNARVAVVQRPTNHHWAVDMKIEDPDGNVLWFGTEPLTNVPFGQELTDGDLLTE